MKETNLHDTASLICRAYNNALADVFDILSDAAEPEDFDRADFAEELQRESLNAMAGWFDKPLEGLEGSPAAFIDSLETPEQLILAYDVFAAGCDALLPEYFQIHLGKHIAEVRPAIIARAFALPLDLEEEEEAGKQEELDIQCVSIELLGQWQDLNFLAKFLEHILGSDLLHERIATAAKASCQYFGLAAVPLLREFISEALTREVLNPNVDYLLVFLTENAKAEPEEESYQMLRRAFKSMSEKIIPIICLGDYGDGRAVPLLRSFVERGAASEDRALLAEALSSIKRLGGNVDDLGAYWR